MKYSKEVEKIHTELHEKKDDENEFLGWLELPTKYNKKEFKKIKECAKKIQANSDVLLVIGIGGSYLGARAVIEALTNTFYNLQDKEERKKFLNWLWDFEFNLYGLPIPSEVFFLNMPVEKSLELMANRENKFTHEAKKDIHESDKNHLIDAYSAACDVAKEYNWYEIKCVKDNKIRTIEDIHEEIYNEIKKKTERMSKVKIYMATLEGKNSLEKAIEKIKKNKVKNILIIPIFLMKGRHIIMDISEGENSWKSILESEGLRVECLMNSLLQYNEIRKLYIEMLDFSDNLQRG